MQNFQDVAGAPGKIPAWFAEQLGHLDAQLVIYWNPFRERFVIDRRTEDGQTTNVLVVEDPEGGFMMPGDRALDKLRSMDAWSKFGGSDEAALQRFRREHELAKEEHDAKTAAEIQENWRLGLTDDRVQINKARHLIQQHDVARPHK